MLDPKLLREQPELVAEQLSWRGVDFDVVRYNELEASRKQIQVLTEQYQSERNSKSKAIGIAKSKGENVALVMDEVKELGDKLEETKRELADIQAQMQDFLARIPNLAHESVPRGRSESDNVEIHKWGTPKTFNFTPKDHVALGELLKLIDFDQASKITGSRFVVMYGALVRLHRALIHFMLDVHASQHGYTEVYVPYIVNADSLYGTGQLPNLIEDVFALKGDQAYFLIPTAEIPVTNLARDVIIDSEQLPKKMVCHSPCFRSEAGSYGKDTRGMIRQHQFEKVELLQWAKPEDSYRAHEELTRHAEIILEKLELPYRRLLLCTGDMGFASAKTYDLEVWLPSQNCYREISSCSNCESFQSRRMQARYRNPQTGKPELLHTLNGSGLAVGRTLIAIMENNQDEAGNIHIPAALQAYMGGLSVIKAD